MYILDISPFSCIVHVHTHTPSRELTYRGKRKSSSQVPLNGYMLVPRSVYIYIILYIPPFSCTLKISKIGISYKAHTVTFLSFYQHSHIHLLIYIYNYIIYIYYVSTIRLCLHWLVFHTIHIYIYLIRLL